MGSLVLEVVEGADRGRRLTLDRTLELGRDPGSALVLDDEQVSRRHARVNPSAGTALIEDLDSTNGTYVNDQAVTGPHTLVPGDRVRLGLTVVELRSEAQ